jgi:hypothetical protein
MYDEGSQGAQVEEEPEEEVAEEAPLEEVVVESEPEVVADPYEIINEVLRGEWGVGQERRLRLKLAGYDPNAIQKEIVRRANQKR